MAAGVPVTLKCVAFPGLTDTNAFPVVALLAASATEIV